MAELFAMYTNLLRFLSILVLPTAFPAVPRLEAPVTVMLIIWNFLANSRINYVTLKLLLPLLFFYFGVSLRNLFSYKGHELLLLPQFGFSTISLRTLLICFFFFNFVNCIKYSIISFHFVAFHEALAPNFILLDQC